MSGSQRIRRSVSGRSQLANDVSEIVRPWFKSPSRRFYGDQLRRATRSGASHPVAVNDRGNLNERRHAQRERGRLATAIANGEAVSEHVSTLFKSPSRHFHNVLSRAERVFGRKTLNKEVACS